MDESDEFYEYGSLIKKGRPKKEQTSVLDKKFNQNELKCLIVSLNQAKQL